MPRTFSLSLDANPWAYLLVFFLANTLISFNTSPSVQMAAVIFGIALPFYVALRTASLKPSKEATFSKELEWKPSALLLFFLGTLALYLRFFKLTTLFAWPNLDEGWIGTLALELSHHWRWQFFYTFGQSPPLTLWVVALFLKIGLPIAWSLWLPSALVSVATLWMAWIASRQFFSKSFSWVFAGLFAFGAWPLLMGRLCHTGIELPLWVCLCALFLGRFQKAKKEPEKNNRALALGAMTGLGSFIFTPWPVVTATFTLTFWRITQNSKTKFKLRGRFLSALFLSLLPFLISALREGYGQHVASLSFHSSYFHWADFPTNLLRHFTVLVWGVFGQGTAYTPPIGGFLNPLLGAFFFMGLVGMFQHRKNPLVQWMALSSLLFMAPGIFSLNLESFRFAQVLPLLLFTVALGFHGFLSSIPKPKQTGLFLTLILVSGFFDFSLLCAPYWNPNRNPDEFGSPVKSIEKYQAFQILNELQKQKGPGLIFTDFEENSFNEPTLSVMTYGFNAARNPALNPAACRWAAIFVNNQYQPFLSKRFPETRFLALPQVSNSSDRASGFQAPRPEENMLGLFPVTVQNLRTLQKWFRAHQVFQQADIERFYQGSGPYQAPLQTLTSAASLVSGDPFLESCFWDKIASFAYENLDYDLNFQAYQRAVTKGYPLAYFYYKIGLLYLVRGKIPEAKKALYEATQAPQGSAPAQSLLEKLNQKYPDPLKHRLPSVSPR